MNPSKPEVDFPVVSRTHAEVPRIAQRSPARRAEVSRPACPQQEEAQAAEERSKPIACAEPGAASFLFDDPYWDEAFDSYHDPTLRTCCRF